MINKQSTKSNFLQKLFGSQKFIIIKDLFNNMNSQISITNTNCIIKRTCNEDAYEKEIKALQDLQSCDNIVSLLQFWKETYSYSNKITYNIMLPYYKDGDLFTYVTTDKFKNMDSKELFKKLLPPIKFCHDKNYIHIDVKLENFLIECNPDNTIRNVVLIDFGMTYKMTNSDIEKGYVKLDKCYGTPQYINPEKNDKIYGKFTDIWCLGIIFYIFTFYEYPKRNFRDSIHYNTLKDEKKNFMDNILKNDFFTRPSIEELINDSYLN